MLLIRFILPIDGPSVAYGMVFLETVQSGLAIADLFYLIGSGDVISGYVVDSPLSPWVGPILIGGVVAMIVQSFFAYRIWVLSNKKSKRLCLTILFVSPMYSKYFSDTGSQTVSLWIVLRCQSNIGDCWEYLGEHVHRSGHLRSN